MAQAKFDYTQMYKSPSLYTRIQNGRRERILMDNNCGKESRCKFEIVCPFTFGSARSILANNYLDIICKQYANRQRALRYSNVRAAGNL